jgi:hypothetical protein
VDRVMRLRDFDHYSIPNLRAAEQNEDYSEA